ncbi:MAG: DMT family transporter [Bacteroidales bacterium]|nr:DMT family transporter [Bacteroidales bacterium]
MTSHPGELAALATAIFWTITALSFEHASKRVGSLAVNMIRLVLAFFLLGILSFFIRGSFLPLDATPFAWFWLGLSGIVGLVLGDYFLFKSYPLITSRVAMLVMTLVPPMTALIGWGLLGEKMTPLHLFGMFLTVGGIFLAIFSRPGSGKKIRLNYSLKGLLFALIGAAGQAGGLVLSKYGMRDYNAFAASHIRIIIAVAGYALIILLLGKGKLIRKALKDAPSMRTIALGSFFGPFLGISFSLLAVKYTHTGIAATIMAIVPILIIPPSVMLFKQKFSWLEIAGAMISVAGVALMFL